MAKLTLTNLAGGYLIPANYNANNTAIITAFDNTLSRDGTSPNTMLATLDMNSNRIINLPSPGASSDPARLIDVQNASSVAIAPSQTGNADKLLTTNGTNPNWSSDLKDSVIRFVDDGDTTKKLAFECSGITTGTTRTLTVPNASTTIVGTDTTQTLTNKTLTSPSMTSPSMTSPAVTSGALDLQSGQIVFPATQNASAGANTLDDYEEGTWTPSLGGTATYTQRFGHYTKIGREISVSCIMSVNVIGTGSTASISGLPFQSGAMDFSLAVGNFAGAAQNMVFVACLILSSGSSINVPFSLAAATGTQGGGAFFTSGTTLETSGMYHV